MFFFSFRLTELELGQSKALLQRRGEIREICKSQTSSPSSGSWLWFLSTWSFTITRKMRQSKLLCLRTGANRQFLLFQEGHGDQTGTGYACVLSLAIHVCISFKYHTEKWGENPSCDTGFDLKPLVWIQGKMYDILRKLTLLYLILAILKSEGVSI